MTRAYLAVPARQHRLAAHPAVVAEATSKDFNSCWSALPDGLRERIESHLGVGTERYPTRSTPLNGRR